VNKVSFERLTTVTLSSVGFVSMKVAVIGLGYLGATTAVALSLVGHDVIGIDPDQNRVDALRAGRVPFFEPGLDEALVEAQATGRLTIQTEHTCTSTAADVFLLCVGTPQSRTGLGADLRYLESSIDNLAPYLQPEAIVVGKSTVPVGTAEALKTRLSGLVPFEPFVSWNPEFLREGTALKDTLTPDRIVIGVDEPHSEALLRQMYQPMADLNIPIVKVDSKTAELVKVAANSFLATKISFINAMAEISEKVGADAVLLAEAIGYDERIGNKFLKTGIGFGGGCLPKDIRAFQACATELGLEQSVSFLAQVEDINMRRRSRVVEVAKEELGELTNRRVAMLGAAFKPGTDDIRDSPAMAVAELLWAAGAHVVVHDPKAVDNVLRMYPNLTVADTLDEAVSQAELVVVGTDWREYALADSAHLGALVANKLVIDGRNVLPYRQWQENGWKVIALGRNLERNPVGVFA
jgi:UDPglucose 6-dehydrogenase